MSLSVSSHSFDDIPTIIGQKDDPHSREHMRLENILRCVKSMSSNPFEEGLIAYGDETCEKEWGDEKCRRSCEKEYGTPVPYP